MGSLVAIFLFMLLFQFPFLSVSDQNWYNMRRDFTAALEDIAVTLFQMQSKTVAASCSGLILDSGLWDIKPVLFLFNHFLPLNHWWSNELLDM